MADYVSCYDPPLISASVEQHRVNAFDGPDKEMFLHVGHYIAWYAAVEFAITMLLYRFTGGTTPATFHILSRGMDAKLKVERLKEAIKLRGWNCDLELAKRLQHFTKKHVAIRNTLVHSHLYWPASGDLQMTSIGAPPKYDVDPLGDTPPPRTISGLEFYERGLWLKAFSHDILSIVTSLPAPLPVEGTLQKDDFLTSLPTGDRPSPQTQARRARAGRPPQKTRSEQQSGSKG